MALIKCKMCGGDLTLHQGQSIAECEYCGTRQTVPSADNEKKLLQFERADWLRRNCEFDKAAGVYETIVSEFRQEAEAYWGLVLCKYGIEYVDDPATGKKVPTCHRSSYDSVMDDENLELTLDYADAVARKQYREEAKQLEALRKGIVEVSGKEAPYDIFICYKETDETGDRTLDSVLAQDIYGALTDKGYRVFFSRISLEDKLGLAYEPYIFAALNSAKVMLAVGTDYEYYQAVWVKNEWSRFLKLMEKDKTKHLIPCFKGLDAYDVPKEFNKLQAQDLGKVGAIQDLLRGIEKLLPRQTEVPAQTIAVQPVMGANVAALLDRGNMALEDGEWEKANGFFEEVLNQNSRCAEAYLGLAMANALVSQPRDLVFQGRLENKSYQRAKQFADPAFLTKLTELEKEAAAYRETERLAAEAAREAERQAAQAMRKRRYLQKALLSAGPDYTACVDVTGLAMTTGTGYLHLGNDWDDLMAISAGLLHTVGLRMDGTVVAAGENSYAQCRVMGWRDVIAISAGHTHTMALRTDGTVLATGSNEYRQCDVAGWKDMVDVSAGAFFSVGLKRDGTVIAIGCNNYGQCDVADWENVIAISAATTHTAGVKADGTVVIAGSYAIGHVDVSGWQDVVGVSAGQNHTVGVKRDGTVVATGSNEYGQCNVSCWTDVVAVSAGKEHTVGLRRDGTLIVAGDNLYDQCAVKQWQLFRNADNLEQERTQSIPVRMLRRERREKHLCQHCGGAFKGVFQKKCTACGKFKDYY